MNKNGRRIDKILSKISRLMRKHLNIYEYLYSETLL